ncbi:MAG: hypothetical protein KDC87_20575, partial [Planctomycetes bacterium]|nr:hypothetical protein [Planctomycetota bacterium]
MPWPDADRALVIVRRCVGEPAHILGPLSGGEEAHITLPAGERVEVPVARRPGQPEVPPSPQLLLIPGERVPEAAVGVQALYQLGCIPPLDLRTRRRDETPEKIVITNVPPGRWVLCAGLPGHASLALPLQVHGPTRVSPLEFVPRVETVVEVAETTSGHMADVQMYLRGSDERDSVFEMPVSVGRTDESGKLPVARHPWRRQAIGVVSGELGIHGAPAPAGVVRVGMTIPLRGVVEGVATEAGERPAADSWHMLIRPRVSEFEPAPALPRAVAYCAVDRDGRFRFPGLEPGVWELRAIRPLTDRSHASALLPLLFPDPGAAPLQKIELHARGLHQVRFEVLPPPEPEAEPTAAAATLRGTVRTDRGTYPQLAIGIEEGGRWAWTSVDPEGSFDTGRALGGPTRVAVVGGAPPSGSPDEYLWLAQVAFTAGQSSVLELDLPVHLVGLTFTSKGRRAVEAKAMEVTLTGTLPRRDVAPHDAPRSRLRRRTNDHGWFRIDLPAGSYQVSGEDAALGWL